MEKVDKKRFKAFISYKHSVSGKIAYALEAALRRYAKPIFKPPIRIFRDEGQLSAGQDLHTSILNALESSEYLIYIASKEAAGSPYVREELENWCAGLKRQDRLIIVWQKDGLKDNPEGNSLVWEESNAIPRILEKHIQGIPIWIDLTWTKKDEDLDLRNPQFKTLINSIIARFRKVAPEQLIGEEIRTHRRNIRIRNGGIAALVFFLLVALSAAIIATLEREKAIFQRNQARSNLLSNHSSQVAGWDNTLALKLSAESYSFAGPTPSTQIAQTLVNAYYNENFETNGLYRTKLYHGTPITTADFSPNGQFIVTGSSNGSVKVWTSNGAIVGKDGFMAHKSGVISAQFSPDSSLILTTGYLDDTVKIWTLKGELLPDPIKVPPSEYSFAEFSQHDDSVLIHNCRSQTAKVWERNGRQINLGKGKAEKFFSARFSPCGRFILTGCSDGKVKLWDREGKLIDSWQIEFGGSIFPSISQDGELLVATSNRGKAYLWEKKRGRIKKLGGNRDFYKQAMFSPDGEHILTISGKTVDIWNKDGKLVASWNVNVGARKSAKIPKQTSQNWIVDERDRKLAWLSPAGKILAMIAGERLVNRWALDGELIATFQGHAKQITSVVFSPDKQLLLTASMDGTAKIWPLKFDIAPICKTRLDDVRSFQLSPPPDNVILVLSLDDQIGLWNPDGTRLSSELDNERGVKTALLSPDGSRIAACYHNDNAFKLWTHEGALIHRCEGHEGRIQTIEFSPDGRFVVTASQDKTAKIWSRDGELIATLEDHENEVTYARFSRGGDTILTKSPGGPVRLWDERGKIVPCDLMEEKEGGLNPKFSPDGGYIMTTTSEATARLWSGNGDHVPSDMEKAGNVMSAMFFPQGGGIVTTHSGGLVRIWDEAGKDICSWRFPAETVFFRAFISPDGNLVVTTTSSEIRDREGAHLGSLEGDRFLGFTPDSQFLVTALSPEFCEVRLKDRYGKLLAILGKHEGRVEAAEFSADGRLIITKADTTLRIWCTPAGLFHYIKKEDLYEFDRIDRETYGIDW